MAPPLQVATLGRRVAAIVVDSLVTSTVWGWVYVATGELASGWVWLAVAAGYVVVPIALWGQTLGKRALGLKVVLDHRPTPESPGWRASVVRYAVLFVPGLVPGAYGSLLLLGVTLAAFYGIVTDELARGLHDMLAGTRVIDVRGGSRLTERYQANLRAGRSAPRPRRKRRRATWQP